MNDQAWYSLRSAQGQELLPVEMTPAFYLSPSQHTHSQSPSAVSMALHRGATFHILAPARAGETARQLQLGKQKGLCSHLTLEFNVMNLLPCLFLIFLTCQIPDRHLDPGSLGLFKPGVGVHFIYHSPLCLSGLCSRGKLTPPPRRPVGM